jgi:sugar-specific transcriptional regulator TrmB
MGYNSTMNHETLTRLGLNPSQAAVYMALVEHGASTAPQIAAYASETRTNAYSVLDKLAEMGLVERVPGTRKVTYRALSPDALSGLVGQHRKEVTERERLLNSSLESMRDFFYSRTEQPGVRVYQGPEEIKQIYRDQLEYGQEILLVRTPADKLFYDFDFMHQVRNQSRKAGIHRRMITPDTPESPVNHQASDAQMLSTRTWVGNADYTAPVEWNVYGDKLAIISFGAEAMGLVIESPQIAEACRQLFGLLEEGLRLRPDYGQLPKLARYLAQE